MTDFLYRFRPLDRLLDKGELENQEIYFAPPQQLNDPMEGFRDVFWRGDIVVWNNLFRHYLICLDAAYLQLLICGEEIEIGWANVPLLNYHVVNEGIPHKEVENEIVFEFFREPCIVELISLIAERRHPVRRNELTAHLKNIHLFAIQIIRNAYFRRNLHPPMKLANDRIPDAKKGVIAANTALRKFRDFENSQDTTEHQANEFYRFHNRMMTELNFINSYNGDIDQTMRNRNFVLFDFVNEYPLQIEVLMYPRWYVACFMNNCRNSSIWGTYGNSHTAVCLKFRVGDGNGKRTLHLKRQYGYGSDGPVIGFTPHQFTEINYGNGHLPIDFFKSIGRFPINVLKKNWYSDISGNESPCGEDIFRSADTWRDNYWKSFEHGLMTKLKDWSHEEEFRLVIEDSLIDFSTAQSRTTSYKFADLDGIIFGINTPMQSKIRIGKIIEAKCRAEGRKAFNFYQAYYQPSTGTIEHELLQLLKFSD